MALAVALAGVALTGCGGGTTPAAGEDAGGAVAPTEPSPVAAAPLADAVRIDAAVDVALAGADFASVEDREPVAVGDVVRTDDAGFAEIAYHDGSVTRLDVDTTLEVLALSDTPGEAEITTRMELGRTWHRVTDDADRDFTVETDVAVATVRGTAFVVDCPDEARCVFSVLEGSIEVTPTGGDPVLLTAPASLEVTAAGDADDAVPVPVVEDDAWLARNAELDDDADFAALPTPEPLGASDLVGEWVATASDPRIASAAGDWADGTFERRGDAIHIIVGPGSGDNGQTMLAGPVSIVCDDGGCAVVDPDGRRSAIEETDGVLTVTPGTYCTEAYPPGVGVVTEVTATSLTFTGLAGSFAGQESCDDHVIVVYDVVLTRAP